MANNLVYLDTYTLQGDSRIRLPKSAIENMGAELGKTRFNIYYSPSTRELVLKIDSSSVKEENKNAK
ncbi:MAG: sucrose-6-phosphate hydrolase [Clostridia bacterium]|nr:sucrose-6-phosphate hydrolase [Clostridia bacterium]